MSECLSCTTGLNYEKSKKNFMRLVVHRLAKYKKHKVIYQLHNKRRIDKIIAQKLEHPFFHPKYSVITRNGRNILVIKKRKTTDPFIQILSWEDIFDKFMPLHVRTGHGGAEIMMKKVHLFSRNSDIEYKFPLLCFGFFRRACNICTQISGIYSQWNAAKIGIVHVIGMIPTRPEEKFRYLLIYYDKETRYTILRPLTEKTSLEISGELYKIFTQFGPPKVVQVHHYNPSLTEKIHTNLNEICPEFKIKTEHQPACYELPTIVTDRIQNWMNESKSPVWEVGCYIVQSEMNNDPQMRPNTTSNHPNCTPHALYFHTDEEQEEGFTSPTPYKLDNYVIDLTSQECNQNITIQENQISKDNQLSKELQVNQTETIDKNQVMQSDNQLTDYECEVLPISIERDNSVLNIESGNLLANKKSEIKFTNTVIDNLQTNSKSENLLTDYYDSDILPMNIKKQNLLSNIESENLFTNIEIENVQTNIRSENLLTNIKSKDVQKNIQSENILTNTKSKNVLSNIILYCTNESKSGCNNKLI